MTRTILYLPPNNRPDILAPSVGGAYPPIRYRHRWTDGPAEFTKWGPWVSYVFMAAKTESARALLLSLNGTPDAIGMGRAIEVLAQWFSRSVPDGEHTSIAPTYWIEHEEEGDCEFGSNPSYPSTICVAKDGVYWRMVLPDNTPDESNVRIVAEMLCCLIGGSVAVIDA